MHLIQPLLCPEFSFHWLKLMGEDHWIEAIANRSIWAQFTQLLTDLSLFLQELSTKTLRESVQAKKFLQMTLQLYLKFQKRIPEYLEEEGLLLLEELPSRFNELEKVICASSFARESRKTNKEDLFN